VNPLSWAHCIPKIVKVKELELMVERLTMSREVLPVQRIS